MYIEEKKLILDEEITDEMGEELLEQLHSSEIEEIRIKTPDIASSIMQILFCVAKEKKIVCDDAYLARFFDTIEYIK